MSSCPSPLPFYDDDGELLAIVVKGWNSPRGAHFFTMPELPLQVGSIHYPSGHVIPRHVHREPKPQLIKTISEVLFIRRGRMLLELWGKLARQVQGIELEAGDIAILNTGWHGMTCIEETELYEVKQGPYLGRDEDKVIDAGI